MIFFLLYTHACTYLKTHTHTSPSPSQCVYPSPSYEYAPHPPPSRPRRGPDSLLSPKYTTFPPHKVPKVLPPLTYTQEFPGEAASLELMVLRCIGREKRTRPAPPTPPNSLLPAPLRPLRPPPPRLARFKGKYRIVPPRVCDPRRHRQGEGSPQKVWDVF